MLASDMNNPEFVGAQNPDSALAVAFRWDKKLNEYRSKEEGRPIYDWMDWIRIEVPGNNLTNVDRPVYPADKLRFPIQWARYEQVKNGGPLMTAGTPLEQWPLVSREIAEALRYFKFYTVENIAEASDGALQGLGMAGGMAPLTLRDKAQAWLRAAKGSADATKAAEEIAEKDRQIEELRKGQEEMQAQMRTLLNAVRAQSASSSAKAKPGRRPREKSAKDVARIDIPAFQETEVT